MNVLKHRNNTSEKETKKVNAREEDVGSTTRKENGKMKQDEQVQAVIGKKGKTQLILI